MPFVIGRQKSRAWKEANRSLLKQMNAARAFARSNEFPIRYWFRYFVYQFPELANTFFANFTSILAIKIANEYAVPVIASRKGMENRMITTGAAT